MIVVLIIVSLIILVQGYIIFNLYSKYNVLLKEVEKTERDTQSAINLLQFVKGLVTEAYVEMQRIDRRGGFQSDDEVGFTFKAIKEVVEQLKFFITELTAEASESSETENK